MYISLLLLIFSCKNENKNEEMKNEKFNYSFDTVIRNNNIKFNEIDANNTILIGNKKSDTLPFSVKRLYFPNSGNSLGIALIQDSILQFHSFIISDSIMFIALIDTQASNGILLALNLKKANTQLILNNTSKHPDYLLNHYGQFFIDTVSKVVLFSNQNLQKNEQYYYSFYCYKDGMKFYYMDSFLVYSHPFILDNKDFKRFLLQKIRTN